MPESIHESPNDCRSKAASLITEIEKYKTSREVNQAAAESLERTADALALVIGEIAP